MRYYAAWKNKGKWRVVMLSNYNFPPRPVDNVRDFATFEEANNVARNISLGMWGYKPGVYVNMR